MAFADQAVDGCVARLHDRRTQDEILGRIADERELRQHDEVGPVGRGTIARAPDARKVAVDVAYRGIELCERDGEMHGGNR